MQQVFTTAANARDLEVLFALYEPAATIIERTGEHIEGTANSSCHLAQLLALKPAMTIEHSRVSRQGDLALLCSHWVATATGPDGSFPG